MPEVSNFPHIDLRTVAFDGEGAIQRRPNQMDDSVEIITGRDMCLRDGSNASAGTNIVFPCSSLSPRISHIARSKVLYQLPRDSTLFWQGDIPKGNFELVEGVVRAVYLCENGGRQILTFFWPGSVIEAGGGRSAFYTAETVTPCSFRQPSIDLTIRASRHDTAEVSLLQEMIDLLRGISGRCALSRIAWFLMRMREHLPRGSVDPDVLRFAVPRLDMADYLGLSLETVSRCLTELKVKRAIDLPNRKTIRFTDMRQLACIANG